MDEDEVKDIMNDIETENLKKKILEIEKEATKKRNTSYKKLPNINDVPITKPVGNRVSKPGTPFVPKITSFVNTPQTFSEFTNLFFKGLWVIIAVAFLLLVYNGYLMPPEINPSFQNDVEVPITNDYSFNNPTDNQFNITIPVDVIIESVYTNSS